MTTGLDTRVVEEGMGMVLSDEAVATGMIEEVYEEVSVSSFSELAIVPFQTTWQDFVLILFGTWVQRWSWESRTKKPGKVALPTAVSWVRKFAACWLIKNARDWKKT